MNETVRVRRVTAADGGRARALRLEMLANAPLAFITTLADAAAAPHREYAGRCARSAAGTRQSLFVAETGGRFVAQAGAFAHPTEPAHSVVIAVYISPSYRRGGLLEACVEAVAEWSRECGRPTLDLEVVTTNARAIRAYRKIGFVPFGEPVPHPTVPVLTEVRMTRPA